MGEQRWPCASAIASRWISISSPDARSTEGAGTDLFPGSGRNRSSGGAGYTRPPCRRPAFEARGEGLLLRRTSHREKSAHRISSDDGVILVASVRDLLATKLKALFDRVEPKDYLDVAEILSAGRSPQGLGRALFGKPFPGRLRTARLNAGRRSHVATWIPRNCGPLSRRNSGFARPETTAWTVCSGRGRIFLRAVRGCDGTGKRYNASRAPA